MKLGMVGLGRMGGNMAERLRRHGHEVVGYDPQNADANVRSLPALVEALEAPRVAWSMVPAGAITEEVVTSLRQLLEPGDVVIDGGNSHYRDSMRRADALAETGVGYIDAGVSGGVFGLDLGYCLMVGGESAHVSLAQPAFDALAPEGGFAHVGPVGTGHFSKMVHNGIEYGLMQAYAEGYELLVSSGLDLNAPAALAAWRNGSVVRSWLLDLLVGAIEEDPGLASIEGWVDDSGEGRWTVQEAIDRSVPVPVISASLYARFASRQVDSPSRKALAALRKAFGGHAAKGAL